MSKLARHLVVINPASARARRAWPEIKSKLTESGVRFDDYETRHAGDATGKVRAALREGYGTIAVVGGDGTLSEAAAGFFDLCETEASAHSEVEAGAHAPSPSPVNTEAALAVLPAGTGDDFARGLSGGRKRPLDEWLDILIAHAREGTPDTARSIDVVHGRLNREGQDFICLNVTTMGLGAEVAARVASQRGWTKWLPGEARFLAAACGALYAWRERRVRVLVDGSEVFEGRTNLIALANGIYAGGGMMFAPDARADDGLLDLLLTCGLRRSTILRELPRIRRGLHLSNPRVRLLKATHVRVETEEGLDALLVEADGNVRGHTPAEFRVIPSALNVVA